MCVCVCVYMLTDTSNGFEDTWQFLDNRCVCSQGVLFLLGNDIDLFLFQSSMFLFEVVSVRNEKLLLGHLMFPWNIVCFCPEVKCLGFKSMYSIESCMLPFGNDVFRLHGRFSQNDF